MMQQHRQLSCRGHDRPLLAVSSTTLRQFQPPTSQITVDPEWSQNVLRSLHQQRPQIGIAFFADVQLRFALSRAQLDRDAARTLLARRMAELGPINFGRIEVQPFALERFGTTFGLVPRAPEQEDGGWWVELQPGNHMAFHEPWDCGEYDT
jgi:hypothetical protein